MKASKSKPMTVVLGPVNSTSRKAPFGTHSFGRLAGSLQINNVDMAQLKPDPVETHPPHRVLKEPMVLYHDLSNPSLEAPAFEAPTLSVSPCEIWNSIVSTSAMENKDS